MNSNRFVNKSRLAIMGVALLSTALFGGLLAPAASQAAPASQSGTLKVTSIPANGAATLKARGFCLDFGKPFPTQAMTASGAGQANVRGALNYAITKGYTASNAQEVQLAIWYLRDNTWHNQSHTTASEIVSNTNGTLPTANALALTDALTQKSVKISAKFVPQTADAYYGDGDVVITNTTSAAINVYMPIGVQFTVPGASGQFQDLLAYELVQAEGTPTAGATTSPAATGTSAATSTTVATSTAVATGTAVETTTSVATVETTATSIATTQATTTTQVATPEATSTTLAAATEVPTAEPTATTTSSGSTLPQTGDGGLGTIMLLVVATGLAMSGLGLIMRARLKA